MRIIAYLYIGHILMLLIQPPIRRTATKATPQQRGNQVVTSSFSSSNGIKEIRKRRQSLLSLLKNFLSMLFRRKWLILLTIILFCLVGVVSYLLMSPRYVTINTVLLTGVLSGLFIGSVIASIREWRSSLLVSQDDLQSRTGYQVIGVIPEVKRGEEYLVKDIIIKPYSRVAEAYRLTATLLLHGQQNTHESGVILITSINSDEGKSVSATNIAYFLAELGTKVLLVDCDLRMPSIHNKLGIQNKFGLINYLLGKHQLPGITQHIAAMPGLFVITAGSAVNYSPVNLLSHARMDLFLNSASRYFDYVILDAPPVRGFADTLLLHSMATSTILVVPEKKTNIDEIKSNLNLLLQVKHSIIGLLKVMATKDTVDKDYYKNYSRGSLAGRFPFKKKKLNLGNK